MSRNIPNENELSSEASRLTEMLYALGRLHSLRDPIASTCDEFQLTPSQVHVLLWLGKDGTLAMGELARRLGVTEKTVTGLVDRLEKLGHVVRERVAPDRRVVRCRLTDEGLKTYQQLDQSLLLALEGLLSLLDGGDRKALFRIVEKLVRKLEPATEAAPLSTVPKKTA
ncbi:MAG TPA: MarR family transcriptional regulator [Myxococcaceae bacterium]|nr:MarR family transcriptional regulator [Myxococcaceae bacterium]